MSTAEILAEAKGEGGGKGGGGEGEGGGEGGGEGQERRRKGRRQGGRRRCQVVARAHAAAGVHISRADARGDFAADADALLTNDPDADADDLADIDTGTAAAKKPTAAGLSEAGEAVVAYARPAKKSPMSSGGGGGCGGGAPRAHPPERGVA